MFNADGDALLIITSGAHRVDTGKVAARWEISALRRADPEFVLASTGQRIGGVAPVGHPAPIRTLVDTWLERLVDTWLERYDVAWAAGGHVHTVFPTTFAEIDPITGGTPTDIS